MNTELAALLTLLRRCRRFWQEIANHQGQDPLEVWLR